MTKAFVRLTGKTLFGPKWSLGYSGSTMHYTDAPDAQNQLMNFIRLCEQHAIPCDSFQLSSGYTSINGKRYVFNWNYDKVPQPKVMSQSFHDAGLKLAANIKPCLLQDHPRYGEVAERGLFIRDSQTDAPERSSFWDDEGSHLDFTNPQTVAWWQEGVTTQLLEMGIDSTWNDNNEYEVWDGEARCYGFGREIAIKHIRPVMPLLMMRASLEAQQRFAPQKRPYLISRSGCAGMQRYVQTWSGDNRTNWDTLRYNIRMGLGMSLSGLFNVGHDVGGFSGDKPEPELFVRWVQNGVMHPRFTIHSWNDDQTVNEAWMYRKSPRRSAQPLSCATACCPICTLCYGRRMLMMSRCCARPSSITSTMRRPSPNAMTSCWAATCWWPAWSSRAPASVKYGCRIIRPVGTISTAISGSPAASG